MKDDFAAEITFAKQLTQTAAELARQHFSIDIKTEWKQDNTPLTVADTAINRLVIEAVEKTFPADAVLGEEESLTKPGSRVWVVDPIDGTMPFSLGIPLFTFCLSLVIDGQPVLGIINDPIMERMYWAVKNGGAFMNDVPIHVNDQKTFGQAFIMVSSRMPEGCKKPGEIFDEVERLQAKAMNYRSFAHGTCHVAAGKSAGAVIGIPNAWDVAATKIIVEEAGGLVTDVYGKERRYDGDGPGLVASNGHMHQQLLDLIAQ